MVDFHEGCESDDESDVPIPKRKWGENYMNGCEQTIEEEFGEVCDESVASLSDDESSKNVSIQVQDIDDQVQESSQASHVTKELPVKSLSSSDEMSSSCGSGSNKDKKKKNGKKTKKESLPPLKSTVGGLPPLKGNRKFLRGIPLSGNIDKSPEKLGQEEIEEDTKLTSNIAWSSLKTDAEVKNNFVDPSMNQSSLQKLAPVKSQKSSSLLGDLPPLPISTSSKPTIMVPKRNNKLSADDIFGAGAYDECEDVDDEDSFGDDDIDALLGGLDQFDAQRKNQQ